MTHPITITYTRTHLLVPNHGSKAPWLVVDAKSRLWYASLYEDALSPLRLYQHSTTTLSVPLRRNIDAAALSAMMAAHSDLLTIIYDSATSDATQALDDAKIKLWDLVRATPLVDAVDLAAETDLMRPYNTTPIDIGADTPDAEMQIVADAITRAFADQGITASNALTCVRRYRDIVRRGTALHSPPQGD